MKIRRATQDDWSLLLNWRNDPVTRAMSRNTNTISEEEHRAWLDGVLSRDDRKLFVAEIAVGAIRLDQGSDHTELSWVTAPQYRGMGFGRSILENVSRCETQTLRAEIKPENAASKRMADRCGFVKIDEANGLEIWVRPKPTIMER